MNWWLDNPISEMPGPWFLGLYASVITLVLVEAYWRKRRADRSEANKPEPIPIKPDPVEIAFLRGGQNEVTRLLVFDLIRRGYLRVDTSKKKFGAGTVTKIERVPYDPDVDHLSEIEADAFDYFGKPRTPLELFQPMGLANRIKLASGEVTDSLRDRGLLTSRAQVGAAWKTWFTGSLMIVAFGGFKFFVALAKGRQNVGLLLLFGFIGVVVLAVTCTVPRLTRRGRDHLSRLRDAFQGLKPRLAQVDQFDPAMVVVPAIFGVSALAGTPYAYAPALFKPLTPASAVGCGGGCGTGGCGGAGGGGGCGGGGGGGGGGCGGGCGGCGS